MRLSGGCVMVRKDTVAGRPVNTLVAECLSYTVFFTRRGASEENKEEELYYQPLSSKGLLHTMLLFFSQ